MTDFVPYEPGTIEVTNGSKNIVGTGTDFSVYSGGDTIWVDGYPVLLDGDPSSDTAALAKYNYLGTSGSGKSYRWVPLGDLSRAIALDTRLSSYFTSGNLSAEAGLTGAADVISYYTGVGTKAVTAFTAAARTVLDDTTVAAMRTTLFDVSTTVDNRIARYDGTAGALQNSAITVDDSGNVSGVGTLAAGATTLSGNLTITKADSSITLNGTGTSLIEIGRVDGSASTPFIDFHAGATAVDYDARIVALTGTGVAGVGELAIIATPLTLTRGQLAMPAAQNASAGANTWDDYEEGSWTSTIRFAGASVGITYLGQGGIYGKTGNTVRANCFTLLTSKGSSTGAAQLGGLPITNNAGYPVATFAYNQNWSATGAMTGYCENAATHILLQEWTGDEATGLSNAHAQNTSNLMCSVVYGA